MVQEGANGVLGILTGMEPGRYVGVACGPLEATCYCVGVGRDGRKRFKLRTPRGKSDTLTAADMALVLESL